MNDEYPWPEGRRAALCVTFDFDGESPFLWRRRADPPVDISELEQRRYGPRRGIYHVLDALARLNIRSTFFVPGWIAAHYRGAVTAVHEAGHEIALHGWCHEPPGQLSTAELQETLTRAREVLVDITGTDPVGYRSPSFALTPAAFDILHELGVRYDSSLMGDDRPYRVGDLIEIPVDWATDDAVYYRYTGGDPRPPTPPGQLGEAWRQEISGALCRGSLVMLTIHPWLSGRPARIERLTELLAWATEQPDLWIGTPGDLAEHHDVHGPVATHPIDGFIP